MKKKFLLTNDDGFESSGLLELGSVLREFGDVVIIAPTMEKSACSHSLNLHTPLKLIKMKSGFYRVDHGTPTDCVYIGLNTLFKDRKPDMIFSGINKGANIAEDITYSGTVGGAMEGAINNIPSIAISQSYRSYSHGKINFDFSLAKKVIHDITTKIFTHEFPLNDRKFLNINVPPISHKEFKGYKIAKAGCKVFGDGIECMKNSRGESYYYLKNRKLRWEKTKNEDSDIEVIDRGYVSITPIHLDMTSYLDIKSLKKWVEKK